MMVDTNTSIVVWWWWWCHFAEKTTAKKKQAITMTHFSKLYDSTMNDGASMYLNSWKKNSLMLPPVCLVLSSWGWVSMVRISYHGLATRDHCAKMPRLNI